MNQVFLGGIAFIIAFILWNSKNKPNGSPFLKSQNDPLKKSHTSSSFVNKKELINQKKAERQKNSKSKTFSSQTSLNSIETNKQLTKLITGNPKDRLLAIQIASKWKNKKAIPFLRRGLRDSDSRVVIASAAAISTYKGKTITFKNKSQASRPPRNVSLTR